MIELASMVTYNHCHRHVIGKIRTAVPGVEIKIRYENGKQKGVGEKGETCIRVRNIMKGYIYNPEASETAFWGERVTAFLVLRPGVDFDKNKLNTHMKSCLSSFKVPKEYMTVNDFPRSPAVKILKRELKEQFLRQPQDSH